MGLFVTPALLDFHSKKHPVVWFGSSLTPFSPYPVSKLSIFLSRRSSLLTGEGVGEEPNRTTARKPSHLKISQYSLPDSVSPFDQNIRVRTRIQIQIHTEKKAKDSFYNL
jgi:hypothetical protein